MKGNDMKISKKFRIEAVDTLKTCLKVAGLLGFFTLAGPMAAQAQSDVEGGEVILENPVKPIPGPKRTVAVSRFIAKSDFDAQYGLSDVGGGLTAILTNALVESGQFIVVERTTLSDVLAEQQLKASGAINQESGPQLSKLVGASLLIMGSITEFGDEQSGMGISIGFQGFGLSPQFRKAKVGLNIRVIDTTTGQVVSSFRVSETAKSRSFSFNINKKDISLGTTVFSKTSLGKAIRKAVERVVHQFAEEVANQPWSGRVVDYEFGEVVINAGANSGIQIDDAFAIQRVMRSLTDPVTGVVLGHRSASIGQVVVTRVEDGLAFGRFQTEWDVAPERGDLVKVL